MITRVRVSRLSILPSEDHIKDLPGTMSIALQYLDTNRSTIGLAGMDASMSCFEA